MRKRTECRHGDAIRVCLTCSIELRARRELARELRRRLKSALGDRWPVARDEINGAMRATRGR